jgi:Ca2+/Na+ antiporter
MTILPECGSPYLAIGYGVATRAIGLDRVFGGFGAPPAVHWALGGAFANYQCTGTITADRQLAMGMAYGYAGGFVAAMIMG